MSAENGIIGVEVARKYRPDLIICDIMMPELDGYGVLHQLRQDDHLITTPFIFLTAKTDRTDIRHGMGLGADDYLTKPFVASELLESIETRLEKRKVYIDMLDDRVKSLSESIITALPHELRTPLNTIIGFSDMLVSKYQDIRREQIAEWGKHINDAAQRLYRLIENYLMYVRTEVISRNPDEIAALKSRVLATPRSAIQVHTMLKAQQYRREQDITITLAEDAKIRISDQDLGKIVEELVDNALKFSKPNTPIEITSKIEDKMYLLTISDHGRGISEREIESIGVYMQFERWFYEQQGSGLGLAIVKRLLKLYDGELMISGQAEQGTCVTVKVRLAQENT